MTSQNGEMPSLQLSLGSMVRSFFESLTSDQVLLLIRGTMDATTEARLLELISNIIKNLSSALQTHFKKVDAEVTEELVNTSLGNTVTESFKAALDVTARGQSRSAETLRDMISEEVTASVQCSMSDSSKEHVPAPRRLNKMLRLVAKMTKAIKKKVCMPCRRGEDSESATSSQLRQASAVESLEDVFLYDRSSTEDYSSEESGYASEDVDHSVEIIETPEEEAKPVKKLRFWYNSSSAEDQVSRESGSSMEIKIITNAEDEHPEACLASLDNPLLQEIRKNTVLLVVERLVSLTYLSSKVRYFLTDPSCLIERLMNRTWAVVEDVHFDSSPKTVADLEKIIFKDLVKKWGTAELLLTSMKAGSPAVEKDVVAAIKARLTAEPKKRSCICRCFSSVGRAIAGICTQKKSCERA